MKHIKENILFSLIDGSIDDSARETHEAHIAECDACFSMYACLKSSYMELTSEELDSVPKELYDRVEAELGIIIEEPEPDPPNYWSKFTDWISNTLDSGLTPLLVPIAVVAVVTFIIVNKNDNITTSRKNPIADAPEWKQSNNKFEAARGQFKLKKIPDLSNQTIEEIEYTLNTHNAIYKIFKSETFSQVPAPGKYYNPKDTIKIYFPFPR